jgi:hypothetical protein
VSDFKYAAINAVLEVAFSLQYTHEMAVPIQGVMNGSVPVVDATAAQKLWEQDTSRFTRIADDYGRAVADGIMGYPVETFCMYCESGLLSGASEHVAKAAYVVFADLKHGFTVFVCALDKRDGAVLAEHIAPEKDEDEKSWSITLMSFVRCFSSWMSTKNAENEDTPAPRASRRRYKYLPSVRFRRVFIAPTTKMTGAQRYEITGDHCPLHHVRGHLRIVSEDRPLFGRKGAHGAFWISEHWRGDDENGRIVQEYVPEAP